MIAFGEIFYDYLSNGTPIRVKFHVLDMQEYMLLFRVFWDTFNLNQIIFAYHSIYNCFWLKYFADVTNDWVIHPKTWQLLLDRGLKWYLTLQISTLFKVIFTADRVWNLGSTGYIFPHSKFHGANMGPIWGWRHNPLGNTTQNMTIVTRPELKVIFNSSDIDFISR